MNTKTIAVTLVRPTKGGLDVFNVESNNGLSGFCARRGLGNWRFYVDEPENARLAVLPLR